MVSPANIYDDHPQDSQQFAPGSFISLLACIYRWQMKPSVFSKVLFIETRNHDIFETRTCSDKLFKKMSINHDIFWTFPSLSNVIISYFGMLQH